MKIKLIIMTILLVFAFVFVAKTIAFVTIQGHEAVVRQDIFKGVLSDVWLSGTKIYCGWTTQIFKYDIGTQKITFDWEQGNKDAEYPPIMVEIGENGGQKAWISLSVNYRVGWEEKKQFLKFIQERVLLLLGRKLIMPSKIITFSRQEEFM